MDRVSSVVRPELKRRQLVKGTALALLGMAILGSCTLFLSIQALNLIGLPAFFLGVALICLGLIPLKRLQRLEIHPHQVLFDENKLLVAFYGKQTLIVPRVSIDRIADLAKGSDYGIGIWLKSPLPKKILVSDRNFKMRSFLEESFKKHRCHLYLPYFTERALKAILNTGLDDVVEAD